MKRAKYELVNRNFRVTFDEDEIQTLDQIQSVSLEQCEKCDECDLKIEVDGIEAGEMLCDIIAELARRASFIKKYNYESKSD